MFNSSFCVSCDTKENCSTCLICEMIEENYFMKDSNEENSKKEKGRGNNMPAIEEIINEYNMVMFSICTEHRSINTRYSEGTEGWGLKEMVEECEYWHGCYYEPYHARNPHYCHDDEIDDLMAERDMLKEFIDKYKPYLKEEDREERNKKGGVK